MPLLGGCSSYKNRPTPQQRPPYEPKRLVHQDTQQANQTILQTSRALASDLATAQTLQARYQSLRDKFSPQPDSNTHATFVGIQGMKDVLRNRPSPGEGDVNKFVAWAQAGAWEQFGPSHNHYDWWMFPLDRNSAGQGWKYTVYQQDIQALKADQDWLKDYRLGAILLMQSYGWDVKNHQPYTHPAPGQQWRNYGIRLGKLANSLILFEQWDLYASLSAYVECLTKRGIKLQSWVLNYFP